MFDVTNFFRQATAHFQSLENASCTYDVVGQGVAQLAAKLIAPGQGWAAFVSIQERDCLKSAERWLPNGTSESLPAHVRSEWLIGKEGLIGYVAEQKKPVNIPDVKSTKKIPKTSEDVAKWYIKVDDATRSELVLPCITGDRLMGVLNLECYQEHAFGAEHESVGQFIANQAAHLMLQKLTEQFIKDISQAKGLDSLTETIVHKLPDVVGARACAIFLFDKKNNHLTYHTSNVDLYAGRVQDRNSMIKAQKGQLYYQTKALGITRWVFDYNIPLITTVGPTEETRQRSLEHIRKHLQNTHDCVKEEPIDDDDRVQWVSIPKSKDKEILEIPEPIWSDSLHDLPEGCRALMVAPIPGLADSQPLGVVRVSVKEGTTLPFTDEDLDLLLLAARQMGVAIENLAKTREAEEEKQEIYDMLNIDTGNWREAFKKRVEPILKNIYAALQCNLVLIRILDDLGKNLIAVAHYPQNLPESLEIMKRQPVDMGKTGFAIQEKKSIFIENASKDDFIVRMREAHKVHLEDLKRELEEYSENQYTYKYGNYSKQEVIQYTQRAQRYLESIASEWITPLVLRENPTAIVGVISAISFQPYSFKLRNRGQADDPSWQAEKTGVQWEDHVVLEYYRYRLAKVLSIARVLERRERQLETIRIVTASMQERSEEADVYRDALIAATHEEGLGFQQAFILSANAQEGDGCWLIEDFLGTLSTTKQAKIWEWVCPLAETLKTATPENAGIIPGNIQHLHFETTPLVPCLVRIVPCPVRNSTDDLWLENETIVHETTVRLLSPDDLGVRQFMQECGCHEMAIVPFRHKANGPVYYLLGTRTVPAGLGEFPCKHIEKSDVQILTLLGEQISSTLEKLNQDRETVRLFQKAVEKVAADTAHKIGAALSSIDLRLSLMKKRNPLKMIMQQSADDLQVLEELVAHAQGLVGEVKNLSGEIHLHISQFRFWDLLEIILREILVSPHGFQLDPAEFVQVCHADREKFMDVFRELASNAAIMKSQGVQIFVEARRPSPNTVAILFRDDGPGVHPHLKSRIFERFFSHRPGQKTGSGLGLCFVQKILEAHGGQITEIGMPGEGACFQILLPAEMFHCKRR